MRQTQASFQASREPSQGDKVKIAVDSVSSDGRTTHYTWIDKFDGTNYPVTGDPNSDFRSYTVVDDHIWGFNVTKDRKVINGGRIVVSADGKTRAPFGESFAATKNLRRENQSPNLHKRRIASSAP